MIAEAEQNGFDALTRKMARRGGVSLSTNDTYAGVTDSNNRSNTSKSLGSVDMDLKKRNKDKATTRLRDHQKNYAVAAWAVRTHLNFIAEQSLSFNTGDQVLNSELEQVFAELMQPENCDARGKHDFLSLARLAESHAIVEGDVFLQKTRDGKLNPIEADRVRDPKHETDLKTWINGVKHNGNGRMLGINVTSRGQSRNQFDDIAQLRASTFFHHGYFHRFDQLRGISPQMAALNDYQDIYENKSIALAKAKLAQMFGIAIFRQDNEGDDDELPDPTKGPVLLELAAGDEAKILQDANPSDQWQSFMDTVTSIALKSIDIPYSFYREDFTNFFGSKSAKQLYMKACIPKRRNLQQRLLNPWVKWQLRRLSVTEYPQFRDSMPKFKWIPLGSAWGNPMQEVGATALEIALGIRSRGDVTQEVYGEQFKDVVDRISEENAYMESRSVPASVPNSVQFLDSIGDSNNDSD